MAQRIELLAVAIATTLEEQRKIIPNLTEYLNKIKENNCGKEDLEEILAIIEKKERC